MSTCAGDHPLTNACGLSTSTESDQSSSSLFPIFPIIVLTHHQIVFSICSNFRNIFLENNFKIAINVSKLSRQFIFMTRKSVHRTRMPPPNAIQKKGLYVTVTGIP